MNSVLMHSNTLNSLSLLTKLSSIASFDDKTND